MYLPFEVPGGVNRIDVSATKQGDAVTGVGLLDQRGSHYQSRWSRGVLDAVGTAPAAQLRAPDFYRMATPPYQEPVRRR